MRDYPHDYHRKGSGFGAFIGGVVLTVLAGGYFLFISKKGKYRQEKIQNWVRDAETEVKEKAREIKDITKEKYDEIADSVATKYSELKKLGTEKTKKLKNRLKEEWNKAENDEEDDEDINF